MEMRYGDSRWVNLYGTMRIDLIQVFLILWRKALLITTVSFLFAVVTFIISALYITPIYTASATLYINNAPQGYARRVNQSDILTSRSLIDTYGTLIRSRRVLDLVRTKLELDLSNIELLSMLNTGAVNNTEIFRLSISHEDPVTAAMIANAFADVAIYELTTIVYGTQLVLIDNAVVPAVPYSTNRFLVAVAGGICGFILISIAVLFFGFMNHLAKIRKESEVVRY